MAKRIRILYGVCGEGRGHAVRAQAVIDHLVAEGHELLLLASNKAYDVFDGLYENLHRIHGFHVDYEDNKVQNFGSVISNLSALPKGVPGSIKKINGLIQGFKPQLCITDFEPYTSYIAQKQGLPCLAIDNINIIDKTNIEYEGEYSDYLLAKAIANFMVPFAKDYLIPTFFYPPVSTKNTQLVQPIFRKAIIEAKKNLSKNPEEGKHILVYQTSKSNNHLFNVLKAVNQDFVIYGFDKEETQDNLHYRPFSQEGMVKDLMMAKGVITNGGFTLMSEALYLGKPVLSEPVQGQFEQGVNAYYLEKMGIGKMVNPLTLTDLLDFLYRLPEYQNKLAMLRFDDNRGLMKIVDEKIQEYTEMDKE